MILNEDTDDGLEPVDSLVVKPDEIPQGSGSQKTIVTPENNTKDLNGEVTPADLFGPNVKVGELPNFDAQFQIVEDNAIKTVDLMDIQEQFSNQGTISQEEAHYLDGQLDGGVFKLFHAKSFTVRPTKANLVPVQNLLASRVAVESLELTKEISIFFTQPAVAAVEIINTVVEQTLPALKELLESDQTNVFGRYRDALAQLEEKVQGCFYTGEKFEHFLDIVVSKYDTEKQGIYYRDFGPETTRSESNEEASQDINKAIAGMQLTLKDHHLCSYLECVREHIPFADQTQEQNVENMVRAEKVQESYTFKDLIDVVFKNPEVVEQLNTLEAELRKVKDALENKAKVYAGGDTTVDTDVLRNFLENEVPETHQLFRNMHHILHIVKNLYLLRGYLDQFVFVMTKFIS